MCTITNRHYTATTTAAALVFSCIIILNSIRWYVTKYDDA